VDDRDRLAPGDRVVLVVEDDFAFARYLFELAHEKGFKSLVTSRGASALALARELKPSAITLDISLPDVDGWRVLDRLKDDPATRHIPVYMISVADEPDRALQQGALGFQSKPADKESLGKIFDHLREFVDRRLKKLLVVEDDEVQLHSIIELVGNGDVSTVGVANGKEALEALSREHFDCMVLDLLLPDMPGLELLEQLKKQPQLRSLPIIVYTGKDLSKKEETALKRLAQTIILKDVRSPERLLDETALFLHRNAANLPDHKRQILENLHRSDVLLAGKKILLVDDDVRNIFAMTSVLERHKMEVLPAETGMDALDILEKNPQVDAVLMDIMLPEMDGYETTRRIRQMPSGKELPIIALTAKAMKGDREKCLEAGASDYIAKPVDTEQLLSLLRVWLYR
jgi:CheY-like chemotaxis protein